MRRAIFSYTLLLAVLLFILSSIQASAQDKQPDRSNLQAVNFYFINGYAVAYKFASSNDWNYRLQLDFGALYSDQNGEDERFSSGNIDQTYENQQSNSDFNITISPQILYTPYKSEVINFYIGFGPVLNYSYSKRTYNNKYTDQLNHSENSSVNKDNTFSAGIRALVGIETFVSETVSVFAETQLTGVKTWSTTEYISYSDGSEMYKSLNDKNGWVVNITNIRIGAGFYF